MSRRNNAQITPGQSFGQLVTMARLENAKGGHVRWRCQCSCGKDVTAMASRLRSGATWRCTCCAAQDVGTKNRKYVRTDPDTPTITSAEFKAWRWMRQAAELLAGSDVSGPAIDPTWDTDFEQWRQDLGPRPDDGSAWVCGRISSLLGFVPGNVEWQTRETRHQRQRNALWWYVDGEKYPSCRAAGQALGVPWYKIQRWCQGHYDKETGKRRPETARAGCYTEPKY